MGGRRPRRGQVASDGCGLRNDPAVTEADPATRDPGTTLRTLKVTAQDGVRSSCSRSCWSMNGPRRGHMCIRCSVTPPHSRQAARTTKLPCLLATEWPASNHTGCTSPKNSKTTRWSLHPKAPRGESSGSVQLSLPLEGETLLPPGVIWEMGMQLPLGGLQGPITRPHGGGGEGL